MIQAGAPSGGADAWPILNAIIIQKAAAGEPCQLYFPAGKYALGQPLVIPEGASISLVGEGLGRAMRSYNDNTPAPQVVIELMSAATDTSAVIRYAGDHLGVWIARIAINGNAVAQEGLRLNRMRDSRIAQVTISAIDGYGLVLASEGASVAADNCMFNRFDGVTIDQCQYGLSLNGSEPEISANSCHNLFTGLRVIRYGFNGNALTAGGGGIVLDCCDNNSFHSAFLQADEGNADSCGLILKQRGRANYFWHYQGPAGADAQQAINLDGVMIGQPNVIQNFDRENGQVAPIGVPGLSVV